MILTDLNHNSNLYLLTIFLSKTNNNVMKQLKYIGFKYINYAIFQLKHTPQLTFC